MAEVYAGKCIGGPHSGEQLAHHERTITMVRPMVDAMNALRSEVVIEEIVIGEYKLTDAGYWIWFGTSAEHKRKP